MASKEEENLKHVRSISMGAPKRANVLQDAVCVFNDILSAIFTALGGADSAILTSIGNKCSFTTTGGTSGTNG